MTLCIGGDKAYPNIVLPDSWHLYVTMSAEDPNVCNNISITMCKYNLLVHDILKLTFQNDNGKPKSKKTKNPNIGVRHRSPEIAKWRAVVERSIGAIKKWKILECEHYLSRVKGTNLQKLLTVICALVNWERTQNSKSW